jgi:hypothetical protein
MRETRPSGSEGGNQSVLPTPIDALRLFGTVHSAEPRSVLAGQSAQALPILTILPVLLKVRLAIDR